MAKDRYLQALRGLAISAVVLIHCLPQCAASVAIRPFLNFSVALFLFLSGVLTDERKFNAGGVFDAALARLPDLMRSGALSILRRFPALHGRLGFWRSPWAPYRLRCTIYWSIHSLCCLLWYCSGSFHGIGSLSIV